MKNSGLSLMSILLTVHFSYARWAAGGNNIPNNNTADLKAAKKQPTLAGINR